MLADFVALTFCQDFFVKNPVAPPLFREARNNFLLNLGEEFVQSVSLSFNDLLEVCEFGESDSVFLFRGEGLGADKLLAGDKVGLPRGEFGGEAGNDFGGGIHMFFLVLGLVSLLHKQQYEWSDKCPTFIFIFFGKGCFRKGIEFVVRLPTAHSCGLML